MAEVRKEQLAVALRQGEERDEVGRRDLCRVAREPRPLGFGQPMFRPSVIIPLQINCRASLINSPEESEESLRKGSFVKIHKYAVQ